jgi:hypothetical protein
LNPHITVKFGKYRDALAAPYSLMLTDDKTDKGAAEANINLAMTSTSLHL